MKFERKPKKELRGIILRSFISYSVIIFFLLLSFKKIRAIIPPPEITDAKLVGFPKYFGYPLYYDTIIFMAILGLPVIILTFFSLKRKQ